MTSANKPSRPAATIRTSLYQWLDFESQGEIPSLLLVELGRWAPRRHHDTPRAGEFGAALLADVIDADGLSQAAELVATISEQPGRDVSFLFISVYDATPSALAEAAKCARAGRSAGVVFVVISVLSQYSDGVAARLQTECDTLLFAGDAHGLLHGPRLFLEHRRLIGYDVADLMEIWRGRIGWVDRCAETASVFAAAIGRAQTLILGRGPASVSLLFPASAGSPTLASRERLIATTEAAVAESTAILFAANEPIWRGTPDTIDIAVLVNA